MLTAYVHMHVNTHVCNTHTLRVGKLQLQHRPQTRDAGHLRRAHASALRLLQVRAGLALGRSIDQYDVPDVRFELEAEVGLVLDVQRRTHLPHYGRLAHPGCAEKAAVRGEGGQQLLHLGTDMLLLRVAGCEEDETHNGEILQLRDHPAHVVTVANVCLERVLQK
eukprot:CAMPEP_0173357324 /NCGR_PEP_ID=MMETSP1144-20121109/18802_1 /TAXON_ID=483371 /ORGANISM="non described non described, Strain CCMP2298" /LENGTH=164 /DNA_ID=CAMNT_0014306221 /DNA_START=513 /DNA_END=1007 /DNA_ORIENTATION=-